MLDYLPEEVLIYILTYLPAKSLLRFTCVFKSWYSLITSLNFITTHLNRTNHDGNKNHLLLFRYYPGRHEKERYILHFDFGDTFDAYEEFDLPCKTLYDYFHILGSGNGLICLEGDYSGYIIMWNPSIRKSVTLPCPKLTTCENYTQVHGFGYDSQTDEYKVVMMFNKACRIGMDSPQIELYKLSTGCWETIAATIDPSYHVSYKFKVFINGAVHWYGYKRGGDSLIVSFDMSDEVFHVIKLPLEVSGGWPTYMALALVSAECISFFYTYPQDCCSMWVMKEYSVVESWTKLYTIDLTGGLTRIGFRRKGEILLAETQVFTVSLLVIVILNQVFTN